MSSGRKQIAVVGGAGYIGAVTAHLLQQAGFDAIIFDNLSTGLQENVKDLSFFKGDITHKADLAAFFKDHHIDAVIHLAGLIEVGQSMKQPARYLHENVQGMMLLLAQMEASKVKNIVFSSSAAVYGEPEEVPIKESSALRPINPYGASKLIGEELLNSYRHSSGLNWVALRYFNVAGAHAGVGDHSGTHLLPLAVGAVLSDQPVSLFGDDFDTKDGTAVRDYVHVADIARAHVVAMQLLFDNAAPNRAINLGSGHGMSVGQMVDELQAVHGAAVKRVVKPRRAGDPATLLADISIAGEVLGWTPQYDVERIVRDAYTWQKAAGE